jgi:hypothetical protein
MVMTKHTPKTTVLDFLIPMTPFIFATQRNILSEKWVSWFKAVVIACKQLGYGDETSPVNGRNFKVVRNFRTVVGLAMDSRSFMASMKDVLIVGAGIGVRLRVCS